MKIFPITFKVGCLELDAIVTESSNEHRFKVEMVTGEPDPIILRRDVDGVWSVESAGDRAFQPDVYKDMEKKIEAFLASIS